MLSDQRKLKCQILPKLESSVELRNYTNNTSNMDQELPGVDDMDATISESRMGFNQKRFRKY